VTGISLKYPSWCRLWCACAALALFPLAGWAAESPRGAVGEIPLVQVKGGCFRMGDIFDAGGADEKPAHEVCVGDFSLARFPVTQGQWMSVMGSNPSRFQGGDELPVEKVSWNDAQAFIKALGAKTGRKWRLPTEAEWEYAARSGGRRQKYPGTSSDAQLEAYAWLESNSGLKTHPVGTRKPNDLGIYDMAGNVWQWVQDRYDRDYYRQSPRQDPQGDPFGANRILKGGAVDQQAAFLRVSYRDYQDPEKRASCVGFRLALSDE
jgi:formylglycine-generating enzyme